VAHAYFTFVTDTYAIANRHKIGVDKILWSSDYPHGNSNYPDAWFPLQSSLGEVPPSEREAIRCSNALGLYGFDK
jgi:predicted TIM-barrel fold metal-dependent hydrolase